MANGPPPARVVSAFKHLPAPALQAPGGTVRRGENVATSARATLVVPMPHVRSVDADGIRNVRHPEAHTGLD